MDQAAECVRSARLAAGLTQVQLAERLGKRQATVAELERPGANPTLTTLCETVRATGHHLELRAVPAQSSVDETLIASYLRMTPAERLKRFQSSHRSLAHLRERAAHGDG
jgi:transcriptional regulator with XRE-family HTH domain